MLYTRTVLNPISRMRSRSRFHTPSQSRNQSLLGVSQKKSPRSVDCRVLYPMGAGE